MLQVYGVTTRQEDCWIIARIFAEKNGKQFLADLFFEIDGRDFEVKTLWGENPLEDCDLADEMFSSPQWPTIDAAMTACNK